MNAHRDRNTSRIRLLENRLLKYRGRRVPFGRLIRSASVAAIIAPGENEFSLLMIRRPVREGDRWSGNVAFPGGLSRGGDETFAATARREAREEVGLELSAPIGRLSDLITAEPGRRRPMRVVPLVYTVDRDVTLEIDPREVAEAFWVDLSVLRNARRRRFWKRVGPVPIPARGLIVKEHILWGLTFLMVEELLHLAP